MSRGTMILGVALALSMTINLLIAGIVIGHRAAGGRALGPPPRGGDGLLMDRALGAVPETLRSALRQQLIQEGSESRAKIASIRAARKDVRKALEARPFDPELADDAFSKLRHELDEAQRIIHAATIATMADAQSKGALPPPGTRLLHPPHMDRPNGRNPADGDRPPRGGPSPEGDDGLRDEAAPTPQ